MGRINLRGLVRGHERRATKDQHAASEHAALEDLVGRLEARLIAREPALAARGRDLQAGIAQLREAKAASARDDAALSCRERALEARVAMVTKQELDLARRAVELAARELDATSSSSECSLSRAKGENGR
ncbi:MAG TPA: hypothetical protein VFI01_03905 [Gaiellaceae bacterium]|nr:hypothetical protein [Gaiellaceae bacterium]